jgi:hypothetical protein
MTERAHRAGVLATVAVLAVIFVVLLAACGGGPGRRTTAPTAPAAPAHPTLVPKRTIQYTAADFSYTGPANTPPGNTKITMLNAGNEDHEMMVVEVPDSVTNLDAAEVFSRSSLGLPGGEPIVAGIHGVLPGEKGSTVVALKPGRYILGCAIASPSDLVTHFDKGMISVLTVP